jgi:hypothetical protein
VPIPFKNWSQVSAPRRRGSRDRRTKPRWPADRFWRYGRTGGRDLFGLAAEAGKRGGNAPLALKANYVEAAVSPTCSTMRARTTARRPWRAERSNSIRASPTPISISPRPTPSAIGISRRKWSVRQGHLRENFGRSYLRQRFAQMEPPLAGWFNRASPRLSIRLWQSSHDRRCLPRRTAVEKLETAHHRSICPIGDAGAISTVRHKQSP